MEYELKDKKELDKFCVRFGFCDEGHIPEGLGEREFHICHICGAEFFDDWKQDANKEDGSDRLVKHMASEHKEYLWDLIHNTLKLEGIHSEIGLQTILEYDESIGDAYDDDYKYGGWEVLFPKQSK